MLAKAIVLITFMFGAMVALLWITVERAGVVTEGSDWVWYLALVLVAVPVLAFAIAATRSRSRVAGALTVTAAVLLAGVVLTSPNSDSVACTPVAGESADAGDAAEGLDGGTLLEDEDLAAEAPAGADACS